MRHIIMSLEEFEKLKRFITKFNQEQWARKQYCVGAGNYFKVGGRKYSYVVRPRSGLAYDKDDSVVIKADGQLIDLLDRNNIKWEEW